MSTLLADSPAETVLGVRLDNAKRDALGALDLLLRARTVAMAAGHTELAVEILELWGEQNHIVTRLIQIVERESTEGI